MKKFLVPFLLALSCACTLAAVGCNDDTDNSGNTGGDGSGDIVYSGTSKVNFEDGEGFNYLTETQNGADVNNGETVNFKVDLGGFYLDSNPVVYVNDAPVSHDGEGNYSVLITEDVDIRVEGVKKDVSQIDTTGSGTMESPFIVTKPIDLIFIADKVNSGVREYVQGAYILANNIDCKGEELKVIGDSSIEEAYFSGCFACNYNSETGEVYDYSISNFKIKSTTSNYVGLFGAVYADLSVTSSGLFYGVKLDNFTIEASLTDEHTEDSKTITCGSLVGYGVGANMQLCSATNGSINVTANEYYFSYVGGLIGYQQAFYSPAFDYHFASEIAYCNTDVDIRVFEGKVLGAGGIVGFMGTNYPTVSVASVHNSYSRGNVSGAMRSGGIAGTLGRYSVVSNCYSTGMISASCYLEADDGDWPDEYKIASAGGLVGYAENDTIAHDCFFNGQVGANAAAGEDFIFTSPSIACGDPAGYASATSQKYIARSENCLENIDLSDHTFLTNNLGWGAYDWVFLPDELPTINYTTTQSAFTLSFTLKYVNGNGEPLSIKGETEKKLTYFNSQSPSSNAYITLGSFLEGGGLPYYYNYDTTADGYRAYGYFFDEACTQKVPNGYMPMRDVTLYVGFEKIAPIVGTYYFTADGYDQPLKIQFREDGIVEYSDGLTFQEAYYAYDGEYIFIDGARFARYYNGDVIIEDDAQVQGPSFDLERYMYYDFRGEVKDGVLSLFDTLYFTADAPFQASTTKPTSSVNNPFKGEWTKSANVNKTYVFHEDGTWTYTQKEFEREGGYFGYTSTSTVIDSASGEYELIYDGDAIRFTHNGVTYTANFDANGYLQISDGNEEQTFFRGASYVGSWSAGNLTLTLHGIPTNGTGVATLTQNGVVSNFVYEETETDGIIALYYPHANYVKNDLFGYFYYNVDAHALVATLYDENNLDTGYTQYTFKVLDEYYGEWITDIPALKDVELIFDGNGLYGHANQTGTLTIVENGEETEIEYSLNSLLEGSFLYKGVKYSLAYDENLGKILVNTDGEMQRKDELAGFVFLDENGNEYVFNGKGNLSLANSGSLSVNGNVSASYTQINNADGELSHYELTLANGEVATLTKTQTHYELTAANGEITRLYIQNEFMGEWAMNGMFNTLQIGATQLDGVIRGKFYGKDIQLIEYDVDVLSFYYVENRQPHTYYLFIVFDETINDNILVLTEYANLYGDDWVICSKATEYLGTWVWNANPEMSLTFDGVHSGYTNGSAIQKWGKAETAYSYIHKDGGLFMWSNEVMSEKYWYYTVRLLTADDEGFEEAKTASNAWYNAENNTVIIREEVDALCFVEAVDKEGNAYYFDGKGNVLVNGEVKYTYQIVGSNANNTTELIVVNVKTGKSYNAILDHSKTEDNENNLFLLGEEIQEKADE